MLRRHHVAAAAAAAVPVPVAAPVAVAVAVACGPRPAETMPSTVPAAVEVAIFPAAALVRETRSVSLARGRSEIAIDDLPLFVDIGSLRVRSRTDPDGTRAIAHVTQPADAAELPAWAVVTGDPAQPLTWRRPAPDAAAPDKPTARLTVSAERAGTHLLELAYLTGGLSWRADYAVVLTGGAAPQADLDAWVTVANASGRTFERATLVLAAAPAADAPAAADAAGPPRHRRYRYPRAVALRDGEQRRLAWTDVPPRPTQRPALFDPVGGGHDHDGPEPIKVRDFIADATAAVTASVELSPLAVDLPPGRARVYERQTGGRLALVGEGDLGAVAAGDPVRVQLGAMPGLTGARVRTDFRADDATRRVIEAFEVTLENESDRDHTVAVREHMARGPQWQITSSSHPHEPDGKRAARFAVAVPARGKAKLVYRVVYTWSVQK